MAEGRFPKIRGIPAHGICQRRFYLDQALLNTASSTPHVTVHTQARVLEPYIDQDGKVIGVVTKNGPQKSQIVIAADGIHSPFRQKLGLDIPVPKQRIGFRLHYKLANTYPSPACVEVFVGKHYEIYTGLLPNNEMLLSVVAWKSAVKDRADAQIKNWIREHPTLVERLTQAEQITSIRGVFHSRLVPVQEFIQGLFSLEMRRDSSIPSQEVDSHKQYSQQSYLQSISQGN
jgi:flavin-dependent dehydrogenase